MVDSVNTYTGLRQMIGASAADAGERLVNDNIFKADFNRAKGIGNSVLADIKSAGHHVLNALQNLISRSEHQVKAEGVKKSIDREFPKMGIGDKSVGDLVLDKLGNPSSLKVRDIPQKVDAALKEVLSDIAAASQDGAQKAKIQSFVDLLDASANPAGGKRAASARNLAEWKERVSGVDALRGALVRDIAAAAPNIGRAQLDAAVGDIMNDVSIHEGLSEANLRLVKNEFSARFGFDAQTQNLDATRQTMEVTQKAHVNAAPLGRTSIKGKAAIAALETSGPKQQTDALRNMCTNARQGAARVLDQCRAATQKFDQHAQSSMTDGPEKSIEVYVDLRAGANQALAVARDIPATFADFVRASDLDVPADLMAAVDRPEPGGEAEAERALLRHVKKHNPEALEAYRDLKSLRSALIDRAAIHHDLATSLIPEDKRGAGVRPKFHANEVLGVAGASRGAAEKPFANDVVFEQTDRIMGRDNVRDTWHAANTYETARQDAVGQMAALEHTSRADPDAYREQLETTIQSLEEAISAADDVAKRLDETGRHRRHAIPVLENGGSVKMNGESLSRSESREILDDLKDTESQSKLLTEQRAELQDMLRAATSQLDANTYGGAMFANQPQRPGADAAFQQADVWQDFIAHELQQEVMRDFANAAANVMPIFQQPLAGMIMMPMGMQQPMQQMPPMAFAPVANANPDHGFGGPIINHGADEVEMEDDYDVSQWVNPRQSVYEGSVSAELRPPIDDYDEDDDMDIPRMPNRVQSMDEGNDTQSVMDEMYLDEQDPVADAAAIDMIGDDDDFDQIQEENAPFAITPGGDKDRAVDDGDIVTALSDAEDEDVIEDYYGDDDLQDFEQTAGNLGGEGNDTQEVIDDMYQNDPGPLDEEYAVDMIGDEEDIDRINEEDAPVRITPGGGNQVAAEDDNVEDFYGKDNAAEPAQTDGDPEDDVIQQFRDRDQLNMVFGAGQGQPMPDGGLGSIQAILKPTQPHQGEDDVELADDEFVVQGEDEGPVTPGQILSDGDPSDIDTAGIEIDEDENPNDDNQ